MEISELIDYLRTWASPSGFSMESAEGISRVLTQAVAFNPSKYIKELNAFKGVDPTYIRGLFVGFRDAQKEEIIFDWQPILTFSKWVVDQPREIPGRRSEDVGDWDPDWGWLRREIAWLINEAFEKENGTIPFDTKDNIWTVLKIITRDPDPTPEYEERYGGSNMDPATLSINSTRGVAFHTLIAFALWQKRNILDLTEESESQSVDLEVMPNVKGVLESHLDIEQEPSTSIRAVYGWKFGSLLYLDRDRTKTEKATIFPENHALEVYRRAAWTGK